ncbi:MAG: hypothetical protein R3321_12850, partial [Nitrososphaeraceae archaeon]|nr:hypothetical protein [Nitrososphaeraceae archaeon]
MLQNRAIAYTSSWLNTLLIGSVLATIVVFILLFLQPFEPFSDYEAYQNLKLIGYGFCIIIPILIIHFLEEFWFKSNNSKWFIHQEIIILTIGFFFISISAYFYNTYVVNDLSIETNYILQWIKDFGLPFTPIFMPIWIYLRFRFSKVLIKLPIKRGQSTINIVGNNKDENLSFLEEDFIMAKAQANYVDIYYLQEERIQKEMIRHSISGIQELITSAQQIHRSYLVNPLMI